MCSRLLRHTVDVLEEKTVLNGSGGSKKEWQPIITSVKCLMDTPSSSDIVDAMQMTATLDRTMFYKRGTVIAATARIRWLNDETNIYETYEQSSKPKDQGGQGRYNALWLKLVK